MLRQLATDRVLGKRQQVSEAKVMPEFSEQCSLDDSYIETRSSVGKIKGFLKNNLGDYEVR